MTEFYTPTTNIDNAAWNAFCDHVNSTYPKEGFNDEQKEFVKKSLLNDENGRCNVDNKLWVNVFADHLNECTDGSKWSISETESTLLQKMEFLKLAISKAILMFFNTQCALRKSKSPSQRTIQEQRMLDVDPTFFNFPIELALDMGVCFNLRGKGAQENIIVSEEATSTDQLLFHRLHSEIMKQILSSNDFLLLSEANSQLEQDEVQEKSESGLIWSGYSAEDRFLRLCCHKLWADKYEQEIEWSPEKMSTEWLVEGIELFNRVSYHWPQCHIKKFPTSGAVFEAIQKTSQSWIHGVSTCGVQSLNAVAKPSTPWVIDWCTYPVAVKRQSWDDYFQSILHKALSMSKLLHKKSGTPAETTDVGSVRKKRSRKSYGDKDAEHLVEATVIGDSYPVDSLEYKIQRIMQEELGKVVNQLDRLQSDADVRQQETLLEVQSHFQTTNQQLQRLGVGQMILSNLIEAGK